MDWRKNFSNVPEEISPDISWLDQFLQRTGEKNFLQRTGEKIFLQQTGEKSFSSGKEKKIFLQW